VRRWGIWALGAVVAIVVIVAVALRRRAATTPLLSAAPTQTAGGGKKKTIVGKLVEGSASLFSGSKLGGVFDFAGDFTK